MNKNQPNNFNLKLKIKRKSEIIVLGRIIILKRNRTKKVINRQVLLT